MQQKFVVDKMMSVLDQLTVRTPTEEKVHQVMKSLFEMKSLRFALQDADMNANEFFYFLRKNPTYSQVYTHIQEIKAEVVADEIIEIADNEQDPLTARNRINARTWYASKIKADKYGDKLQVTNVNVDLNAAIEEANARRSQMLASYEQKKNVIEVEAANVEEGEGVDIFS